MLKKKIQPNGWRKEPKKIAHHKVHVMIHLLRNPELLIRMVSDPYINNDLVWWKFSIFKLKFGNQPLVITTTERSDFFIKI